MEVAPETFAVTFESVSDTSVAHTEAACKTVADLYAMLFGKTPVVMPPFRTIKM